MKIEKVITIPDFMIVMKTLDKVKKSAYTVQYETKITYCHIHKIKKAILHKGWITIEPSGVSKLMVLTEKGNQIVQAINYWLQILEISDEDLLMYRQRGKINKEDETEPVSETEPEVVLNINSSRAHVNEKQVLGRVKGRQNLEELNKSVEELEKSELPVEEQVEELEQVGLSVQEPTNEPVPEEPVPEEPIIENKFEGVNLIDDTTTQDEELKINIMGANNNEN